jgi:hypothetical protein
MRRDLDLYRRILIDVEEKGPATGNYGFPDFPDVPKDVLTEHCRLLIEDNMVDGRVLPHMQGVEVMIFRLTTSGHNFLANIRNDTIWAKTKDKAKSVGATISIEVLKQLAVAMTKSHLGLPPT